MHFTNKVLDFNCELYLFDEYLAVFYFGEYSSQIRFLTLFVNCIHSMNIWQFFLFWQIQFTNKVLDFIYELYLFDEYLPVVFLGNTVQKYSPQIRFSSLFVNCIGEYSSEIKSRTLTFNDRSLMNLIPKHQNHKKFIKFYGILTIHFFKMKIY